MKDLLLHIQWIFSGIGVVLITGLIGLKKKKNKNIAHSNSQSIKMQSGDSNIQTKGDVHITNTTTTNNIYNTEEVKKKDSPINLIAEKFYKIFEDHGVSRGQIPSFTDKKFNIQYIDVEDINSIIPKLNDELLDWVSDKFGIQRSWFDAKEDDYWNNNLYNSIDCYKQHWTFFKLFEELIDVLNPYQYRDYIKVKFIKNFDEFKAENSKYLGSVLIIVEVLIGKTTTGPIYKYILINNNLRWDYWKSRQDIKRMIRIVDKLDIYNSGFDLSNKEFEEISSERIVPKAILDRFRQVTWYPYDYDGSFNAQIDESEYEENRDFQESLKIIDREIKKMLENKKQEFRNNNYNLEN